MAILRQDSSRQVEIEAPGLLVIRLWRADASSALLAGGIQQAHPGCEHCEAARALRYVPN